MILSKSKFGHEMRKHFLFDEKWVNLNHGSHGAHPKQVADAKATITRRIDAAPDKFLRYDYKVLLNESRQRLAQYLHVPFDECVLVQNATTALDTVMRNLPFTEGDVILCFDTIYDAVEKSILCVQEAFTELCIRKVGYGCHQDYRLPMSHAEICSLFVETVKSIHDEGLRVKVAVFDTVTSVPAVRLPFVQLTRICREHSILSVIDGAHGVGQFPLNLAALDADFFVSNCHKWLYTPRSCALLHVPKRNQHLIRNTVPTSFLFVPRSGAYIREQSRGETPTDFVGLFQKIATMDETPLYCIPSALNFRAEVCGGEHAIFVYIRDVAQRGADILAKELGTEVMGTSTPGTAANEHGSGSDVHPYMELRDCAIANISLPLSINSSDGPFRKGVINPSDMPKVAAWMQRTLTEYDTTASIFPYRGQIWVRVMGQIYLELSDFKWFAEVLKVLCKRVEAGEPFL